MAASNSGNSINATILAQTIIVANQAAASAKRAEDAAAAVSDKAPINSPIFTGIPQAPTASANDNSAQIATTEYLDRLLGTAGGVATLDETGKIPQSQIPPIQIISVYVVADQAAMLALSDAVVGSQAIVEDEANAQYILTELPPSTLANWIEVGSSPVLSVATLTGAISAGDLAAQLTTLAPKDSPTFTGTPAAPTASAATNTTQIATTAYVKSQGYATVASPTFTGTPAAPTAAVDTNTSQVASTAFVIAQKGTSTPLMDGSANAGASTRFASEDHIHPTDTTLAPLASPTFTGTPAAPTAAAATNTTQIATTAFVTTADNLKANIASPTFTGTPAAPTASPGTNTTQISTTAFVAAAVAAVSGFAPIPASSSFPVGMTALLRLSTGNVSIGASVGGSSLNATYVAASWTGPTLGTAQTGTWLNITGAAIASGDLGQFVRTA